MKVYTLYRVDFDNLENRPANAITRIKLGVFASMNSLRNRRSEEENVSRSYEGWNHQIYPQFITEVDEVVE